MQSDLPDIGDLLFGKQPPVLADEVVRLEPLVKTHQAGMSLATAEPELWKHLPFALTDRSSVALLVERALQLREQREHQPFAIVSRSNGEFIGATHYMDIVIEHRRLEIGSTWIRKDFQGTAVNSRCKLLLLNYAFDVLRLNRVSLKTDILNTRSQRAIEAIGATKEGVFRRHMVRRDGSLRDTVYYSFIAEEWPQKRKALEGRIRAKDAGA